jgi:hypothetical protein
MWIAKRGIRPYKRQEHWWVVNFKVDLEEIDCGNVIWIQLAENSQLIAKVCGNDNEPSGWTAKCIFLNSKIPVTCSRTMHVLVTFQVLTAASMKMALFWVVAPCSLVEDYRRFKRASCFIREVARSGDLPDYTVQQPRRQASSMLVCCTWHSA